ncbi:MAG: helix-turn-helix domain-containing protein [Bacillota bacterium]
MKNYTIKEAADLLDVSTSTIRRRIRSGKIYAEKKKTKFGSQYFIPEKEINKVIAEEEIIDIKESNKPIPLEDVKKQIINIIKEENQNILDDRIEKIEKNIDKAIKSQNKELIEKVTYTMEDMINKQNEVIKDLKEEIKNEKEGPIKKFFRWLFY